MKPIKNAECQMQWVSIKALVEILQTLNTERWGKETGCLALVGVEVRLFKQKHCWSTDFFRVWVERWMDFLLTLNAFLLC